MGFVEFVPPKAVIPVVTAQIVALAKRMGEYTADLRVAQQERIDMENAEEIRRNEYVKSLYAQDAVVRLADTNMSKSGQAMNIIKMNVPDALHTAASIAAVSVRTHEIEMSQYRHNLDAANDLLERRRNDGVSTDEEAALLRQYTMARLALDNAAERHQSLIDAKQRAEKLVNDKIEEIMASCE